MRDIKFRGWNIERKKMLTPIFEFKGGILHLGASGELKFSDWTVMQFTGLKDKNGKEIYEGDIVAYKITGNIFKHIVTWGAPEARWLKGGNQDLSSYQKVTEVIGNIYENPDLLGSK